jgi:cytochrome c-type biogenesis protein CcmH
MAEDERVRTARVEARARNISHHVRCLEYGHQSIEESAADIVVRLRKVVHTNDLQPLALPMAN